MSTLNEQLSAAIAARKDTLKALRGRIADMLDPIPVGVILADEDGEVCRIIRVCAGASQWGGDGRRWDLTIKGRGALLPSGRILFDSIAETELSGNTLYYRKTGPYMGGVDEDKTVLAWAAGKDTRAAAIRLARAIERYMDECRAEKDANEATLA